METRKIIKSGNSLAVVIPAETVKKMNLKQGDTVAWVNGAIIKVDAELIEEAPSIEETVDELPVETKEPDNLQVYAEAIKQQEVEILSLQNKVIELKAQCNEQEKMLKVMAVVNNLGNDILRIFRGEE